jgi:hypothetical protein
MAEILTHQIGVTRVEIVSCVRALNKECLEHARQCEWYAARTNDEADRKFLLRKANHWTKLAREKETKLRASARTAA